MKTEQEDVQKTPTPDTLALHISNCTHILHLPNITSFDRLFADEQEDQFSTEGEFQSLCFFKHGKRKKHNGVRVETRRQCPKDSKLLPGTEPQGENQYKLYLCSSFQDFHCTTQASTFRVSLPLLPRGLLSTSLYLPVSQRNAHSGVQVVVFQLLCQYTPLKLGGKYVLSKDDDQGLPWWCSG